MYEVIETLFENLTSMFYKKEYEIRGVILGLISGEPTILIGEPGTAKTELVETLSKSINNCKFFNYLMTYNTTVEELLGDYDYEIFLKEKRLVKNYTNTIVDSHIVFLDEIFKSSSHIRNTLLDIMLRKEIRDGTKIVKTNNIALYFSSNEIESSSENIAFFDRLTIRIFTSYVPNEFSKELYLTVLNRKNIELRRVELDNIIELQKECKSRLNRISKELIEEISNFLIDIEQEIRISDRKKIKLLKIMSANSIISGREEITIFDLYDVAKYVLPNNEKDLEVVEQFVTEKDERQKLIRNIEKHISILTSEDSCYSDRLESIQYLTKVANSEEINYLDKHYINKIKNVLLETKL